MFEAKLKSSLLYVKQIDTSTDIKYSLERTRLNVFQENFILTISKVN